MKKRVKGILVDVEKQDVCEVEYHGMDEIHKLLKCDCFTIAFSMPLGTALFVDDEGYCKGGPKKFFKFKSMEPMQWLAGNGLFVTEDEDGDETDVIGINIEFIKQDTVFMQCDDEESCPTLPPSLIIAF